MSSRWLSIIAFVLTGACVDQLKFEVPQVKSQVIVDGFISTNPGPYTVRLSTSLDMNADSLINYPIEHAQIKLFDDEGNSEQLKESSPGVYMTGSVIRGQRGHAYAIRVETAEGKIFESVPDTIYAAGHLDTIQYEYESRIENHGFGNLPADVFKITANGNAGTDVRHSIRWRFTHTFLFITNPELYYIWAEGFILKYPLPCSGYRVEPGGGGGLLVQYEECTCCTCYVTKYEAQPNIAEGLPVTNNQYNHIKLGEIPINNISFANTYIVQVEQMSISRQATEFYKLLRQQKLGSSNIFQPSYGRIKGNLHPVNNNDVVTGLFWATEISAKTLVLDKNAVPYPVAPMDTDYLGCTHISGSSTTPPPFWK